MAVFDVPSNREFPQDTAVGQDRVYPVVDFSWSSWSVLFLEKCTLMMGVRIEKANELLNPLRYVFEDYRSGKESDGFVWWTV